MPVPIDRHIDADFAATSLRRDVLTGLARAPKELPPKWFYDERGSELFEDITRLDEYYPTRREREILIAHADEIATLTNATTLVELGSGSSEKTRLLLSALGAHGTLRTYVPVDVSESALLGAAGALAADFPELQIHGVLADFEHHLDRLPNGGRRLVAFLGGTVGNFTTEPRRKFLADIRSGLVAGDFLLLGTDLVKDTDRLVRAYDDASGVTAAFNKNVLSVVNRELKADFDPESFEHVSKWNAEEQWIEMRLRSTRDQDVAIAELELDVHFDEGEEMLTEVSAKFTRERLEADYAAAGFELAHWWTDEAGDYAVTLATPH